MKVHDALDEAQAEAAAFRGGHAYVAAGPGAGKTRVLVERYRALRTEGVAAGEILVLTFSRRAVQELRDRLVSNGFPAGELDIRTFHGFAARVIGGGLARFRDGRLLDGFSRALVIETALAATPTPSLSTAVRNSEGFRRDLNRLVDELGRVPPIENVAGASQRVRDLLAIQRAVRAARAAVGGRDLGDLVGRAVSELAAPGSPASTWLRGRYRHVLIDEFQDTDRVQLDLLAALAVDAQLFAVGDEAQSIYRFRGAGEGTVPEAVRRFAMRRFALTESRRCPPDVCALASAAPISGLAPLSSSHATGERVRVVRVRRADDEVHYLADEIEAAIVGGRPAEDIAVLLRAFRPIGPLLVDELQRRGIAVAATGREELLGDPRVGALRAALDVLAAPNRPEHWLRLLTAPPLGFEALPLRFAGAAIAALRLDASLPDALDAICRGGAISGKLLGTGLLFAAEAWNAGKLATAARRLVRRLGLLAATIRDEPPIAVRAAAGRLRLICEALRDAQTTATRLEIDASCRALVERFDELLPALALDDAGLDTSAPGVRVLTVHGAKGLEFEHVFIADAVNGHFPQPHRATTLLSDDDRAWLADRGLTGPLVIDSADGEEASLWYVAVTRAKERLTVVFSGDDLDGSAQSPTRFLSADRVPADVTIVDRSDLLVSAVRDGDEALRARLAAAGAFDGRPVLAAFARDGVTAFDPVATRPIESDRPLSVSDAETWLACPRKLFYRRFARVPESTSEAMDLGTLLHDTLDAFHERRADFRNVADQTEAWAAELVALRVERWEPERFPTPQIAAAAAQRADVALRGYAVALSKHAADHPFAIVAREQPVSVAIEQHTLSGRIDRIDIDVNGSRTIVDYKSGHAKDPQLDKAIAKELKAWDAADEAGEPRSRLAGRAPLELTIQLPLYATAIEQTASIAFVYLGGAAKSEKRNGAVFEATPIGDAERRFTDELRAELRDDLLDPLAGGQLTYLPVAQKASQCTFCSFETMCPGPEGD
jgi:DNA helicase-2/ATP-dependent DNA helicase PcrA